MTVINGAEALASDYNTLKDAINKWFADDYTSISFGNSNQNWGWGGSQAPAVVAGDDMLASQMDQLRDRCNIGVNILSPVSGLLTDIDPDDPILASNFNDTESKSDLISANRLDIDPSELSLYTGGISVRSTNYSSSIDCVFQYSFNSFNEARYFWNTGGGINISGGITGYTTGAGWAGEGIDYILTTMGTITMNYTETIQSGSLGSTTNIGYYDLTSSYQTIFSQGDGGAYGGAYAGGSITIEARRNTLGTIIEIRVTIDPGTAVTADGITTINSQYRKLDNQSSGVASLTIASPTPSVTDNL